MSSKLLCPKGCKLRVPATRSGSVIRCPKCRAIIRVPELPEWPDESDPPLHAKLVGEPPAKSNSDEPSERKPLRHSWREEVLDPDPTRNEPPAPPPEDTSSPAANQEPASDSKSFVPKPSRARKQRAKDRMNQPKADSATERETRRPTGNRTPIEAEIVEATPADSSPAQSDAPPTTRDDRFTNRAKEANPSKGSDPGKAAFDASTEPVQPVFQMPAKSGDTAEIEIPAEVSTRISKDAPPAASAGVIVEPPVEQHTSLTPASLGNGSHKQSPVDSAWSPGPEDELPKVGMLPDAAKLQTARALSFVLVLAGFFTMAPAAYQLVVWARGLQVVDIDRWVFVLFFLAAIHFLYAMYLSQLPDWSSVWVVSFLMLVITCIDALCLGGIVIGSEQGPVGRTLQISESLRSQALLWILCMASIHGLLCYFCGREAIRWKRTFDSYTSVLR